jgi:Domain of unknown function (DUF4160)
VTAVTVQGAHRSDDRGLPQISRFRGLSILLYFDDHPPPHFHVRAGDTDAIVVIRSGRIEGRVSSAQRALLERWRKEHVLELIQNWKRAAHHEPIHRIEPLR